MRQPLYALAAIAGFGLATSALAADYEYNPSMVGEAAFPVMEEYTPVETVTRWYIRGDLGVDVMNIPETFNPSSDSAYNSVGSISGSIAAGYAFNDLFRMEGELGYTGLGDFDSDPRVTSCPGVDSSGGTTTLPCTEEVDGNSHAWTFLLNGFFDFGTIARITPYVGAGAGIAYTDYGVYTETLCTDTGSVTCSFPSLYNDDRERKFHFAYQLSAGASYDLSDKLKLDLGYRLFSIPGAKQLVRDGDDVKFEDSTMQHQIRFGLRLGL